MTKCRITVIKRTLNPELANEYCGVDVPQCPFFDDGQVFICDLFDKPKDFCDWAWNDINKAVSALNTGGSFTKGIFNKWMKDDDKMIVCCTDGIRPVIFKIERIDLPEVI
jgi:uncharacterized repeat protein (TIGR04076 family)